MVGVASLRALPPSRFAKKDILGDDAKEGFSACSA
jgi:hypothetical protein